MNKYLVLILFLLLVACQSVSTPTKELLYETPSLPAPRMKKSTQAVEPKHPYEPSFTPPPTFTLEPTPIPQVKADFSLVFAENPVKETAYFDFDIGSFNPILEENDIAASVGLGSDIFLVLHPLVGSLEHSERSNGSLDFDYKKCKGFYGKGGVPINPDLYYCWKTNKGHLVQVVVFDIGKGDITHGIQVNFEYVMWSQ